MKSKDQKIRELRRKLRNARVESKNRLRKLFEADKEVTRLRAEYESLRKSINEFVKDFNA